MFLLYARDSFPLHAVHTTLDGADASSLSSPLLLDPAAAAAAINPGATAHLMGVPAAFHPLPPFMGGPPPPLLPPLGYMPAPPLLPLLPGYLAGGPGGLPSLPLPPPPPGPPGEMRPPPLGRLMSPPPLGVNAVAGAAAGGRYSPLMDGGRDHRYHRGGGGGSGRYTPDDYAYDSDDDRHYDDHHHHHNQQQRGGGGGGRRSPYDPETDFSPPPSPDHRYNHQQQQQQQRDGGGGRIHHNPATSRNGNGGGRGHRDNLYSPPRSIKSDTTSRSKGSRPRRGGRCIRRMHATEAASRSEHSSSECMSDGGVVVGGRYGTVATTTAAAAGQANALASRAGLPPLRLSHGRANYSTSSSS